MRKINLYFLTLLFLMFSNPSIALDQELRDIVDTIDAAKKDFNDVDTSEVIEAVKMDKAFEQIDKVTEFVKESLEEGNEESAIKALEFIEKSLAGTNALVPQEFSSDMSKADMGSFGEENMKIVNEITAEMKEVKEEKLNDLISGMVDISEEGLDAFGIVETLDQIGIETIDVAIALEKKKEMETWTKEEWANSWKGDILTDDGKQIISDDEISSKLVELEVEFQEKTISVSNKRTQLADLNTQLDPLNNQLQSLNERKSLLTSQYNLELSKLSSKKLSELETQKTAELTEKLKNQIENVTSEVLLAEQKSNSLNEEILELNKSINDQILASNKLRGDIDNLNQNKLSLLEDIALKSATISELKGQSSEVSSDSNIADLRAKLDESEKLKSQLNDLQSQIDNKNLVVSEKISEVNNLNNQLDPLSNQIKSLQEQKEALQNQYNSQISNISSSFNNNELIKSQELAQSLNNEINSVNSEIKNIQANSSQIKSQISQISSEIDIEKNTINKITLDIGNSQKNLENTLKTLSSKELELDSLRNTDLAQVNQQLNQQLNKVSLQKDFIEAQFERSIDLEVEALQRYHTALGNTAEEIDFAMREVGVILDSDPRKARAFEIEKYATYAGLSQDFIQRGINAVNNDDWDAQKNIYKDITKALAKNPNWVVDVPSDAEVRIMMAEEKAIQEAALASLNIEKIQKEWNDKINEQVKDVQPLASLNLLTLKSAMTWEGMKEHAPLQNEINKILSNTDFELKNQRLNELQKEFEETSQWLSQAGMLRYTTTFTQEMEAEYSKKYYESVRINAEYFPLSAEINQIKWSADRQARDNLITQVEQAKIKFNEITSQVNPEYEAVQEKVSSILKDVPTFEAQADSLAGLDATTLRARLVDLTMGNNNESNALEAARKAMAEIGDAPVSEYMTGPYWEMTNVKAAAIVRSKKYDYVDDYEYINAYYRDPLQLNTSQREEVESELKNVLGKNNPKLNALNKQASVLRSEIDSNNTQLANLNENISKLENEIGTIKSSEENLKSQISKLNNDLTSKHSIINEKNKSLSDLQQNLDPISNKINELEAKKNSLSENINKQIAFITENTKKSEEVTQKTLELESKLSAELSEIDKQIEGYKAETEKLTVNIQNINNEIVNLESEKPDLSNQISKLNEELTGYANVKAELSLLTQEQKVEIENIDTEISKLENELNNLKNSESQINQQIATLTNELKSKENIINNNNLSIKEIQQKIDPLNTQIENLEQQKVTLNEQFNKDLTELSIQIKQTSETDNSEIIQLRQKFDNEISKINLEIDSFENQASDLNKTLISLNDEIKLLETETPDISNQISKLNQELINAIEIKADLAMTQALKSGINVNEKIIESVAKLENKSIIQIEGTELMRIVDTDTLTDDVGDFEAPVGTFTRGNQVYLAGAVTREQILSVGKIDATGDLNIQLSEIAAEKINSGMFGLETAKGLVATDEMAEGTYSLIDPKTGRQVLDSHTGNALYGGIICSGDQCGPSGDLGKKVAASGYVFVRTGDIDQGGMCAGGDCAFNISKSELETFNKQIADGVESPFGYDDALAAATVNTKGLVLDSAIGEAAGEVTKEFFSGKFNIMEEGGAEALLQKAKDAVTRLETAKASGQQIDENVLAAAKNQVAAEQSVVDAVNAAKAAASSTTEVASAASEAASAASSAATEAAKEVTQVVQAAAHEIVEGVRAEKNVVQLVQNSDGSIAVIVGRTGVNVTGSQKVVYTGLTDAAANSEWGCNNSGGQAEAACGEHKKAIAEAEAASGLTVTVNRGD